MHLGVATCIEFSIGKSNGRRVAQNTAGIREIGDASEASGGVIAGVKIVNQISRTGALADAVGDGALKQHHGWTELVVERMFLESVQGRDPRHTGSGLSSDWSVEMFGRYFSWKGFIFAALLLFGVVSPVHANAPEAKLAEGLAGVMARYLGDDPVTLLAVAPPPETTPIPRDEAVALARRVAGRAIRVLNASDRVTLLATEADLADSLAAVQRRRGADGFRTMLKELAGQKADWALLSEIRPVEDGLRVRLRVMDLGNGAIHGATAAVTLDRPAPQAGDARAALRAGADELFTAAARTVGVRPLTYGTTNVAAREGHYLASLLQDGWLSVAEEIITGDPPKVRRLVGPAVDPPRFVLTGTIWRLTAERVEVRLLLLDDGSVIGSTRKILSTHTLPADIARALDPNSPGPTQGFAPIYGMRIVDPEGAVLEMASPAGAAPVYEVCTDVSPKYIRQCDTLQFNLRANRDGVAMCISLGRDGSFGMLIPARHYGPATLQADQWRHLPISLPESSDGGRPVWYAQGEPGVSLVACFLFAQSDAVPRRALQRFQGERLDPREVLEVRRVLEAASPLAEAHTFVTIVAKGI